MVCFFVEVVWCVGVWGPNYVFPSLSLPHCHTRFLLICARVSNMISLWPLCTNDTPT